MDCCVTDATCQTVRPALVECPECGARGRKVKPITLRSLLIDGVERRDEVYRFCATPGCPVVYFGEGTGDVVHRDALRVRVGQKETAADRPICYCFDFSAADVTAEVATTGSSTIPDRITEHCRRGEDRCPETNPQGSCCLGNVRAFVKEALATRPG